MKLKSISLAVAAASLMSGAHAIAPTGSSGFDTIGAAVNLVTAGASAQDKAVIGHVLNDICSGNIDIFTNTAAIPGTNDTAISCTTTEARLNFDANGDGDTADTTTILFRKLSGGGSANGILPVANGVAPAALYTALNTSNCTQSAPITLLGATGVTPWVCSNVGQQALVPTVGFADTEPALFAAGGPNSIGAFNVADIESTTSFILTFGVQVTKNLRDALQAAQGLTTGSDSLANMPSLSLTNLASLYSGKITNWNTFTSPTGATLSAVAPIAPINDRVHVVRRTVGSGTQATEQALILSNPCGGENLIAVAADNSPLSNTSGGGNFSVLAAGGAATVHEESSAGNTILALDQLQTNNQWAIGFNSLEVGSNNTRFIKVNGAEPTVKQVAGNAYPLWAENQITIKAGTTGYARAFYNNYKSGVALTELNATFNPRITEVTAAISNGLCEAGEECVGYLNPPTGTTLFSNANPTATANRRGTGNNQTPSMCRPAVIQRAAVVEDGKLN